MRERSWRREGSRMLSIKHKPVRRLAPPIIYHELDFVTMDTIVNSGPAGPEKGEENEKLEDAINIIGGCVAGFCYWDNQWLEEY